MKTVTLLPLFHRKQECIAIYFDYCRSIQDIIKKVKGTGWSRTHKCWYTPFTTENHAALVKAIGKIALINFAGIESYLEKRKHLSRVKEITGKQKNFTVNNIVITKISEHNLSQLELMMEALQLKAYSSSTIKTYKNEFCSLLQLLNSRNVDSLTESEVKRYILYCINALKLRENTIHSPLNALKFYFEKVLHKEKFFWEIPRPKKQDQLPKVLGENEIGRMFNAINNIKHKAILFTAYSAGLRVSEVVNLKIKDVDSDRMQLFIEKSKGKKDRYAGLGVLLLDVLRAYLKSSKPMPKKYVFENPLKPGEPYSVRSAQKIFQVAKEKALITKNLGIHSLRHSFATHLLEKDIDIRYIKDLLGHFSIKTTERYLHVKRETLISIPNVLDELNKTLTLKW